VPPPLDVLDRRRVYIFPSRPGLLLFGVIGLVLIGATNYDNALAFVLCFLLLALSFSTMLRTWRNLAGLSLETRAARPVYAGQPACFELTLHDTQRRARYSFALRRLQPKKALWWWRPKTDGHGECAVIDTGAAPVTLHVPTHQRGWLVLGRVEISSRYPLGLFYSWAYFRPELRCLVYPAPRGTLALPGADLLDSNALGSTGAGMDDFAELRAYVAGDSLRSVHWKASARSDDLLVKKMAGGGRGDCWLRWRDTASLGDAEARISQLASWTLQAELAGQRYGLEIAGLKLAPDCGPSQRERVLRALALLPA